MTTVRGESERTRQKMDVAIRILAMIGMFIFGYMLGKESKGNGGGENG